MKTKLLIAAGAAMLLSACNVNDPIHYTEHPEHGKIVLTTDWSQRGEGVAVPERYYVKIGETALKTFTGATNEHPELFAPGTHRVFVYHDAAGITVGGNTVSVGPNTRTGEINSLPGWFFSCAMDVTIEKDKVHEITATMQQQVRELTLVIEPTGDAADKIESITATLSGVAGTLNINDGTHGSPSDIALTFTKGADGKWSATMRLLGIAGIEQSLTGTATLTGGMTAPLYGDLSAKLTDFNDDKQETIDVAVEIAITPDPVPLTVTDDAKYDIPAMTVGTAITDIDLSDAITGGTEPFTFTVTEGTLPAGIGINPATGVISGTPTTAGAAGSTTITITDSGNPVQSVTITIGYGAVSPTPTYTIKAEPATLPFGEVTEGYSQPAAKEVTVTNTGNSAVTLTQPTATNYVIGTLSTANLAAGATATFTVQPKAGLGEGTYNADITITATGGGKTVTAKVSATFSVSTPPSYTIGATPAMLPFGEVTEEYATAPAPKEVTITNTGSGTVTLTQPTATNYVIGTLSTTDLAAGATAKFTVQPKSGLTPGNKNEDIVINGSNGATTTVTARLTVINHSYTISASPATLTFADAMYGYATVPAAQNVTITNTGSGAVTLTQPTTTKYDITLPSPATIPAGQSATVSIRPKTGLAAGAQNETITISGSGASAQVLAQFTVDPVAISAASVAGVTAPVANVAAATQTTPGTGFTGAVSWSPALETGGKFGYNTPYTATITLTAAANHIFSTTSGWTVAGAPNGGAPTTTPVISNGGKTLTIKVAYTATGTAPTAPGIGGNIDDWGDGNGGEGTGTAN